MVWGGIIAWYLFLAGLGAGAYLTSALIDKVYPHAHRARRLGRIISPVAIIIGLMLLMLDAKAGFAHPWRFLLLIDNLQTSVMSWGVIFLSIFVVVALWVLLAEFKGWEIPAWLNILGCIFAVCVAAYTGVLLGVVVTAPLWNTPLLPVLFLVSALSAGVASVFLATSILAPEEMPQMHTFSMWHLVLPVLELILLTALLVTTAGKGETGYANVMRFLSGDLAILFWGGLVIIGLISPVIMELFGSRRHSAVQTVVHEDGSISVSESKARFDVLIVLANIFVLIGGFLLRYLVVTGALPMALL
ncbi:MAG: polysulfide reductase NrfD [Coriobacteriia bacterium]|nr:polysulfide reductase NrfD [Coriobacteriia bacterium]